MRWLVVAFALLFGTVMTAEAAHLHRLAGQGHFLQAAGPGSPSADAEEHCPLCVAVHPALPAPIHVAPAPVLSSQSLPRSVAARAGTVSWHFARFGRPPPEVPYA